jgi:ATP-dependent DNA helicase RecG
MSYYQSDYAGRTEWENTETDHIAEDIDEELLLSCCTNGFKNGRRLVRYKDGLSALTELKLLINGHLTNAGHYLLSKNKPVTMDLAIYATDEKNTILYRKQFHGNIIECIDEAQLFIKKNMRWKQETREFAATGIRSDIPEIPLDVLNEVVINAFCHADYCETSVVHEINIFPGRIEISNPGCLMPMVGIKGYLDGTDKAVTRNPAIAGFLYVSCMAAGLGTGFRMIDSACNKKRLRYAYDNRGNRFTFIFFREPIPTRDETMVMTDIEFLVYSLIKRNRTMTAEDIAQQIDRDIRTVFRKLSVLKEKELIERSGTGKKSEWDILR